MMRIRRLLWVSTVVVLAGSQGAEAMNAAPVVLGLRTRKAECLYLQKLCRDARAAKREAEEAMSTSRAFHARAKAILAAPGSGELRVEIQREGQQVQGHLTAASRRRVEAAAAFADAMRAVTMKHGLRPACATCPGISDGPRPPAASGRGRAR